VREIVIVIADLYLPRGEDADGARAAVTAGTVPGIEYAGRFGERSALTEGWRAWLAHRIGRADLAHIAPARIAAVCAGEPGAAGAAAATAWIATPVQLVADLTRVHLPAHGILRLQPAELAALTASFRSAFGGSGLSLHPLPCGELLLFTAGMAPLDTLEPARAAGGDLAQVLPQGREAASLRRLGAEIEMWLHGEPLNSVRAQRGEAPVTALWLWGSAGAPGPPLTVPGAAVAADTRAPRAFGSDAWLDGLWRIQGSGCERLPPRLPREGGERDLEVWVPELRQELARADAAGSLASALVQLDARFISPAIELLRRGAAHVVTLIANDTCVRLGQRSGRQFWRRARPGLRCFL
jgi:hypothetical protein